VAVEVQAVLVLVAKQEPRLAQLEAAAVLEAALQPGPAEAQARLEVARFVWRRRSLRSALPAFRRFLAGQLDQTGADLSPASPGPA
jgi:hypothetical protein